MVSTAVFPKGIDQEKSKMRRSNRIAAQKSREENVGLRTEESKESESSLMLSSATPLIFSAAPLLQGAKSVGRRVTKEKKTNGKEKEIEKEIEKQIEKEKEKEKEKEISLEEDNVEEEELYLIERKLELLKRIKEKKKKNTEEEDLETNRIRESVKSFSFPSSMNVSNFSLPSSPIDLTQDSNIKTQKSSKTFIRMEGNEFRGDIRNEKIEEWLEHWEAVFQVNDIPEEKKTIIASLSLKDGAKTWFQGLRSQMQDQNIDINTLAWKRFKEEAIKSFPSLDSERAARTELKNLRQGRNEIKFYINLFQSTALRTRNSITELTKIETFLSSLSDQKVMEKVNDKNPKTLQEACSLVLEYSSYNNVPSSPFRNAFFPRNFRENRERNRDANNFSSSRTSTLNRIEEEHLDAVEIDEREKQRRRERRLCYVCGNEGHFAKFCTVGKKRRRTNYYSRPFNKQLNKNSSFIKIPKSYAEGIHSISESLPRKLLKTEATITQGEKNSQRRTCWVLVDSGASENFLSTNIVKKLGLKSESLHQQIAVQLADGSSFRIKEMVKNANIEFPGFSGKTRFLILPQLKQDCILGMPWLEEYQPLIDWKKKIINFSAKEIPRSLLQLEENIKKKNNEDRFKERRERIIKEYKDVFPECLPPGLPPKREQDHKIDLEGGVKGVAKPAYKMSPSDSEELRKQLDELLKAGFIQSSTSSFAAPVLFVKKKDGTSRMCIDYRNLNKITLKNKFAMPRTEELFDQLHGARIFSKLDLRSGYHQIRMSEKDVHKTAFITKFGHFEFKVLPFGLTNAPATFQALMLDVLRDFLDQSVVVFLDDILIYSKNEEEHEKIVKKVLEELRKHKLFATLKKCEFFKEEVQFIGHKISKNGVAVEEAKIKVINEWPTLKNVDEVRRFLGLANYYRKFIKDFSAIAQPLTDKLSPKNQWSWGEKEDKAFKELKEKLSRTPVLITADPTKPFILNCDASGTAVGAVLQQDQGNGYQPIAFLSKKLNEAEKHYPVHEQELLAAIIALKTWRHYVYGSDLTVVTDHQSLVYFQTQENLSSRQRRWNEFLSQFAQWKVEYRQGKYNSVADALSRISDHDLKQEKAVHHSISAVAIRSEASAKELVEKIKLEQEKEEYKKWILSLREREKGIEERDGIWKKDSRIIVPNNREIKTMLMFEVHDCKTSGHLGVTKTIERISRQFWWPSLRGEVRKYVLNCVACAASKYSTQKRAGLTMPLIIPTKKWEEISMDWVGPLPETKQGNNSILVVVDRLSKFTYLIATKTTATAEETARLVWQNVIRNHGVPLAIVSDRDRRFQSLFWEAVWGLTGTTLKRSTPYHPQTDGQTEVQNRTMESILRTVINFEMNDWEEQLIATELAINTSISSATGFSPARLNGGEEFNLPLKSATERREECLVETAGEMIERMNKNVELAKEAIKKAQEKMKENADKKKREIEFVVGEEVMVSLNERQPQKLDNRFAGPLKVTKVLSPNVVELEWPEGSRRTTKKINIEKLKKINTSEDAILWPGRNQLSRPLPIHVDGEEEWEIEKILRERSFEKGKEFLVRWKGYPPSDDSWIEEKDLNNSKELLQEWKRSIRKVNSKARLNSVKLKKKPKIFRKKKQINWVWKKKERKNQEKKQEIEEKGKDIRREDIQLKEQNHSNKKEHENSNKRKRIDDYEGSNKRLRLENETKQRSSLKEYSERSVFNIDSLIEEAKKRQN